MDTDYARKWLIVSSILITGVQVIFFLVAPAVGYPLEYPKNLEILQLILPVFLGYLGAAAHFVFKTPVPSVPAQNQFLGLLIRGPILVYVLAVLAVVIAFGYSNRIGAPIGPGMSVANLTTALAIALSILAATTGVLSSYLFVAKS